MASRNTLEIQKEEPRKIRIIRFGRPKDRTEEMNFRVKQRRKKNTMGAFG